MILHDKIYTFHLFRKQFIFFYLFMDLLDCFRVIANQQQEPIYKEADGVISEWMKHKESIFECIQIILSRNHEDILYLLLAALKTMLVNLYPEIMNDFPNILEQIQPFFSLESIVHDPRNWEYFIDILAYIAMNHVDSFDLLINQFDEPSGYKFASSYLAQMKMSRYNHREMDAKTKFLANLDKFLQICASDPSNPYFLNFLADIVDNYTYNDDLQYLNNLGNLIVESLSNPQNTASSVAFLEAITNNSEDEDFKFLQDVFLPTIQNLTNHIEDETYHNHIIMVWEAFLQPNIFVDDGVELLSMILPLFAEEFYKIFSPNEQFSQEISSLSYSFSQIRDKTLLSLEEFLYQWLEIIALVINQNSSISLSDEIIEAVVEFCPGIPDIVIEYVNERFPDPASLVFIAIVGDDELINSAIENISKIDEKPFTILFFIDKFIDRSEFNFDNALAIALDLYKVDSKSICEIIYKIAKKSPWTVVQNVNEILKYFEPNKIESWFIVISIMYSIQVADGDVADCFNKMQQFFLSYMDYWKTSPQHAIEFFHYVEEIITPVKHEGLEGSNELLNPLWKNLMHEIIQKFEFLLQDAEVCKKFSVLLKNALEHGRIEDIEFVKTFAMSLAQNENGELKGCGFQLINRLIESFNIPEIFTYLLSIDIENSPIETCLLAQHFSYLLEKNSDQFFANYDFRICFRMLQVNNPGVLNSALEFALWLVQFISPQDCAEIVRLIFTGFLTFYLPGQIMHASDVINQILVSGKLSNTDIYGILIQVNGGEHIDFARIKAVLFGEFNSIDLLNAMKALRSRRHGNVIILKH